MAILGLLSNAVSNRGLLQRNQRCRGRSHYRPLAKSRLARLGIRFASPSIPS